MMGITEDCDKGVGGQVERDGRRCGPSLRVLCARVEFHLFCFVRPATHGYTFHDVERALEFIARRGNECAVLERDLPSLFPVRHGKSNFSGGHFVIYRRRLEFMGAAAGNLEDSFGCLCVACNSSYGRRPPEESIAHFGVGGSMEAVADRVPTAVAWRPRLDLIAIKIEV